MENICCEVCNIQFNETTTIPKVLNCGHTVCLPCVTKLIDSNPSCPMCRSSMSSNVSSYPTNYSLMSVCSSHDSLNNLKSYYICRCQIVKKKLEDQRTKLNARKGEISNHLNTLNKGISSLDEMIENNDEELNWEEKKETLRKLEEELKKIEKNNNFSYWQNRLSVTLNMNTFNSAHSYLYEIYRMILEGWDLFSVYFIEDRLKYGKLSLKDDTIVIHALTLSEMPVDATSVWFGDLKKCLSNRSYFSFLNVSCNSKGLTQTILIELRDSTLATQFLKLCTGELGSTYSDCVYTGNKDQSTLLHIEKYLKNGVESNDSIEYCIKEELNQRRVYSNDGKSLPVYGKVDGSFEICENNRSENLLGKLIFPLNLKERIEYEDLPLKVVDCGLCISMK